MHKEQGTPKLLYSSECYNDDVPYWVDLPYEKDLPEEEKEGMLLVVSLSHGHDVFGCVLTTFRASHTTMTATMESSTWLPASLQAVDSFMSSISNPPLTACIEKEAR